MQARIDIRPYGNKLIATDTRKEFGKLTGVDTSDLLGCVANSKDGSLVLGVFDSNVATLIHELMHVVLIVAQHVGINPFDSEGEPLAYLIDDLFTEVSEKLWVRRKCSATKN